MPGRPCGPSASPSSRRRPTARFPPSPSTGWRAGPASPSAAARWRRCSTPFSTAWRRARGAGVIHLVRESLAECVASTLIAGQRGYHRRTPIAPPDAALRVTADLAAAERQMRDILAARAFVRRAFRGHASLVELAYPDFIDGERLAGPAAGPRADRAMHADAERARPRQGGVELDRAGGAGGSVAHAVLMRAAPDRPPRRSRPVVRRRGGRGPQHRAGASGAPAYGAAFSTPSAFSALSSRGPFSALPR